MGFFDLFDSRIELPARYRTKLRALYEEMVDWQMEVNFILKEGKLPSSAMVAHAKKLFLETDRVIAEALEHPEVKAQTGYERYKKKMHKEKVKTERSIRRIERMLGHEASA